MLNLAALFVYFIDVYTTFRWVLFITLGLYVIFAFIVMITWFFNHAEYNYDTAKEYKTYFLKLIKSKFYILMMVLCIICPSVKTIYISSGLLLGQQAVNKAENSELLNKAYKVLELQMNNYLDELVKPMKSEKTK